MGKTGHSESIWITLVGKYWKSCKMAKIAHSELFWTTLVRKYWKSWKTAKIGHSESGGKYWKIQIAHSQFRPLWKILEKLKNGQN